MMVTKEQLAQLRAERSQPHARLEYTIDGPIHTHVVESLDAERESRILLGERAMQDALRDMRREQSLSRHHGHAKAIFNNPNLNNLNREIKP